MLCLQAEAFGEFKFWSVNQMMRHTPVDMKNIRKMKRHNQLLKQIDQHREKGTTKELLKRLKKTIDKHKAKVAKRKAEASKHPSKSNFRHDSEQPTSTPGNKVHMIKIYGEDHTQYYYMNLMMGKPLRQQSVIIDTGSDLTAVPCSRP